MVSWGLLPHPILYLSVFFEHNRDAYYHHLLSVSTSGTWSEWLAFFLRGVALQARDAVSKARKLLDLQAAWREALKSDGASATVFSLADSLFDRPVFSISAAADYLGVNYPAGQRAVTRLAKLGIVRQVGDHNYGKVYAAQGIFDIVAQGEEQD